VSIDPSFAANLLSLGVMLYESGYRLDAIDRFLESLVSMPASAEAWLALGVAEKTATRSARAHDCLVRALTLREVYPEASAQLAALFFQLKRPEDALAAATRAVNQSPQSLPAWATQGQVLRMLLRPLAAEPCFQRCLVWQPAMAEYWVNLGIVRQMQDFFDEAMVDYERAVVADRKCADGYANRGLALKSLGNYALADECYSKAIVLRPDQFDSYVNSGLCNLLLGNYQRGWRQYERRWDSEGLAASGRGSPRLVTTRGEYSGPPAALGKRVLVWAEQGVGDEVMFGGLLGEFRGLCGELLLQVDRRLMGLFERALPGVRVFERGKPVPAELYDEQIPMGSLGKWLRPTRESCEGKGGRYLKAQEGLGRRLRAELGVGASEKLIGLSWRSASAETGAARSLSLKALVGALQGVEGVRFLNLQYGEVSEELRALREETGVEVLTHPGIDNREDLEGLAGLIEGCDLVVSVGNATAHLSGALGQKTWVLLPYVAGWRWLHEGERCPWYQSVRLFRQVERGEWTPVLAMVRQDLARTPL
jgi:tetratricopeptide (TPR) repeat protein